MKFNNLKIGTKLTIGFGMVLFITFLVSFIAIRQIREIATSVMLSNILVETVNDVNLAMQNEKNYLLRRDKVYIDENKKAIESMLKNANTIKSYLKDQTDIDAAEDFIKVSNLYAGAMENLYTKQNEIDNIYSSLITLAPEIERNADEHFTNVFIKIRLDAKEFMVNPNNENAKIITNSLKNGQNILKNSANTNLINYFDQYATSFAIIVKDKTELLEIEDNMVKLRNLAVDNIKKSDAKIKELMFANIQSASSTLLILSIIAIILGIFAAIIITRAITGPIKKGVDFATQISKGDLTAKVNYVSRDEVGMLCQSLTQMANNLENIVAEINQSAQNIASASMQMSNGAQNVSQGASEQASSTEEISSSMEQMTASIMQNTDNSNQTQAIAQKAVISIKDGFNSTENAVQSMREIATKIQIINDIAFQTNILALNAAVEAARAGEHGKGFAVVAAEVRKLAERSKIAADEINGVSNRGVAISEKAGKQLSDLVPEIERTANLIQEIYASSNEQNNGANQINMAIQTLSQITQQNAAASEEMASSSEELASQAENLADLIAFFKTTQSVKAKKHQTAYRTENVRTEKLNKADKKLKITTKPDNFKHKEPAGALIDFEEEVTDSGFNRF